jgi:hypothetical protein
MLFLNNITINGCGFSKEVAALSFAQFKKEFEHSYCIGRSDKVLQDTYDLIKLAANGNASTVKEKGSTATRSGEDISNTGNTKK